MIEYQELTRSFAGKEEEFGACGPRENLVVVRTDKTSIDRNETRKFCVFCLLLHPVTCINRRLHEHCTRIWRPARGVGRLLFGRHGVC